MKSSNCIAVVLCITVLAACKRDVVTKEPNHIVDCRISKVTMKMNGMKDRTGVFTYNTHGDPTLYTPVGYSTGSVKHEFRYDQQRRLTDYIGYYPTNPNKPFFEFWIRYYYDNQNNIIRDTAFYYGSYGQFITDHANFKTVTTYEYDDKKRVSRTVSRQLQNGNPNGIVSDYKYIYNEDGNLVTANVEYDDKVSIYRTHKLLMFLSRNYSVNNIRRATAYNAAGLPSTFPPYAPQRVSMSFLNFMTFLDCDVEYECK